MIKITLYSTWAINKNFCLAFQTSPKLADLYLYLDQSAPFGQPVDVNPTTVKLGLKSRNITTNYSQKVSTGDVFSSLLDNILHRSFLRYVT